MMDMMSLIALAAGIVAYMGIGMLWYSPLLFGNMWMKVSGIRPDETKDMTKPLLGGVLIAALVTTGLMCCASKCRTTDIIEGAKLGFWMSVFFVVPTQFSGVLWCKKPFKLFLLDSGCFVVTFMVIGGIVTIFR